METGFQTIYDLFQQNVQYTIPLFQRHYVWGRDEWEALWEDIEQKYSLNLGCVIS